MRSESGLVAAVVSGGLLVAAVVVGSPASAAGTAACAGWQVVASPSPGQSSGLTSVAATSGRSAWAVGSRRNGNGSYRTLIERWDGTSWKVVPSADPAAGASPTDTLDGVVATAPSNAWAVGFYEKTTTSFRTLIEHWNGVRWAAVSSPNSGNGENTLAAAAARTTADIWAVGYRQGAFARRTLIEHWNGKKWSIVPSPNVGRGDNFLFGVAAVSATQAWAVGSDSRSFGQTLAMRWNGSRWSVVPTPNPGQGDRFLLAVAAPTARSALAVGSDLNGATTRTLAQRWAGSAWSLTPSPSPGRDYNSLQAVAATSAGNAWAAGTRRATPRAAFRTLAEHWNGTTWTVAATPSPGRGDDSLSGIAAIPRGNGFWAVGAASGRTLIESHC